MEPAHPYAHGTVENEKPPRNGLHVGRRAPVSHVGNATSDDDEQGEWLDCSSATHLLKDSRIADRHVGACYFVPPVRNRISSAENFGDMDNDPSNSLS